MAELRFLGMIAPRMNVMDKVAHSLALEEIAAGDAACSTIMSVHNSVAVPIAASETKHERTFPATFGNRQRSGHLR